MVKSVSVMQDTCFFYILFSTVCFEFAGSMLRSGVSPIDAIANGRQAIVFRPD